jgi:hypothetical protein
MRHLIRNLLCNTGKHAARATQPAAFGRMVMYAAVCDEGAQAGVHTKQLPRCYAPCVLTVLGWQVVPRSASSKLIPKKAAAAYDSPNSMPQPLHGLCISDCGQLLLCMRPCLAPCTARVLHCTAACPAAAAPLLLPMHSTEGA